MIELKVPPVGESIQEVQIGKWLKQAGQTLAEDQPVVELETDKASLEVPAPAGGVLAQVLKREGESVSVGEVIGLIEPEAAPPEISAAAKPASAREQPPVPVTPSARRALREHGLS